MIPAVGKVVGNPHAFVIPNKSGLLNEQHIVYRSEDGHVHTLYFSTRLNQWVHVDLHNLLSNGYSLAISDPFGYYTKLTQNETVINVIFTGEDNHIHHFFTEGTQERWLYESPTQLAVETNTCVAISRDPIEYSTPVPIHKIQSNPTIESSLSSVDISTVSTAPCTPSHSPPTSPPISPYGSPRKILAKSCYEFEDCPRTAPLSKKHRKHNSKYLRIFSSTGPRIKFLREPDRKSIMSSPIISSESPDQKKKQRSMSVRSSSSPQTSNDNIDNIEPPKEKAKLCRTEDVVVALKSELVEPLRNEDNIKLELNPELESKRRNIINEIFHIEQNYVNNLKTLVEVFYEPLCEVEIVTRSTINSIFSNCATILQHHQTFYKLLGEHVNNSKDQQIGSLFTQETEFFLDYPIYVNNYNNAITALNKCLQNPLFHNFIRDCEKKPEVGFKDLSSFLIMPIQQIPRYCMLIKNLLSATGSSHSDYGNLQKGLQHLEDITLYINEQKRRSENISNLARIQSALFGKRVDVTNRKLICEGGMKMTSKEEEQKCYVHVFTDLFLLSKPCHKDNSVRYKVKLVESWHHFAELQSVDEKKIHSLIGRHKVLLTLNSRAERDSWLSTMKELIEQQKAQTTGITVRTAYDDVSSKNKALSEAYNNFKQSLVKYSLDFLVELELVLPVLATSTASSVPHLRPVSVTHLFEVTLKMRHILFGVACTDREKKGKIYKNSFIAREVVDWIYTNLKLAKRTQAIHLATHMSNQQFILPASMKKRKQFQDNRRIFIFNAEKIKKYQEIAKSQNVDKKLTRVVSELPSSPLRSRRERRPTFLHLTSKPEGEDELSESDCIEVMVNSEVMTMNKDEVILNENSKPMLCQLVNGSVRWEKQFANIQTTYIISPNFLGQSYLWKERLAGTFIVESNTAEVRKKELKEVIEVLSHEPFLSMKFFKSIAVQLAHQLSAMPSPKRKPNTQETNHDLLLKHFQCHNEEILGEYRATFKSGEKSYGKRHGTAYLSKNCIYFISQVFGSVFKEIISNRESVHIKKREIRFKIILSMRKKKRLILMMTSAVELEEIHAFLTSVFHKENPSRISGRSGRSHIGQNKRLGSRDYNIDSMGLTEADWEDILKDSDRVKFQKDEVIIQEGLQYNNIYQILQGTCRIEQQTWTPRDSTQNTDSTQDCKTTLLAKLGFGEMFGEISFLLCGEATASVLADVDGCEVYVISSSSLLMQFVRKPVLAGRFYQYLASILSERLDIREHNLYDHNN